MIGSRQFVRRHEPLPGLEYLDPESRTDVEAVARLFEAHMPTNAMHMLGPRLVRRFLFSRLVRDGLVDVLVCRVNGSIEAFLAFSEHPRAFYRRGLRRHPFCVAGALLAEVATHPERSAAVWHTARRVFSTFIHPLKAVPGTVEALFLVVPPQFQRHVPEGTRTRLPVHLLNAIGEHARAKGLSRVIYGENPNNLAINLLLTSMGFQFEKLTFAWETVHVYTQNVTAAGMSAG